VSLLLFAISSVIIAIYVNFDIYVNFERIFIMADFFGAIASKEIGCKRAPLVFPEPTPKNGIIFPLEGSSDTPTEVYKKISSREELDALIEELRVKYEPFMQKLAPRVQNTRSVLSLTAFDMREAEDADIYDFSRVLSGGGEWTHIDVPYYFGPTGATTHYYRTTFSAQKPLAEKSAFLCFDGVDYIAEVFLNGSYIGSHEGFFAPFEFDVTPYVREGENTLVVTVRNDYVYGGNQGPTSNPVRLEGDKMYAATGPGYDDSETGWHHCPPGAGIYQGVRFEVRSRAFISDIFVRPIIQSEEIELFCEVYNCDHMPINDIKLGISVYGRNFECKAVENLIYEPITFKDADHGETVALSEISDTEKMSDAIKLSFLKGANLIRLRLPLENARLWEPDSPYLYEAQVSLFAGNSLCDVQTSTFGMRSFSQDIESSPKGMFYINGKSIRLRGANTMGYEQQDVIRGDFDALLYDMLMAKACNMNFLRLTQRPVQKEIYELCDSIGLMLQTDLPLFTVMRRTKFAEGVRQAEEMEKLIRSHPSSILISYMNEPMANAGNRPHRHFVREEMEAFFSACDTAVRLLNPDRVIKHIDGDYDPPDSTMPDNHCYCTWYNGHGIDIGKLHRGYWLGVKEGWYYGCGEFGAEGLDPVSLMRESYPKHWLPQTDEEGKNWEPGMIKDAQSGNMHFFYYDTQEKLEDWVQESHRYQAIATKMQTEAFRRDARMATIAIHLFIDAWPSGWMKTIVDCQRNPKPAYFAYRDALTPLMINVRSDRFTYFDGELISSEIFICNDTHEVSAGHKLIFELLDSNGRLRAKTEANANFAQNSSFIQGEATVIAPSVDERQKFILRAILTDADGKVIHYCDENIEVFPKEETLAPTAEAVSGEEFALNISKYTALAANGKTVVVDELPIGVYSICGTEVNVKARGMRPLHFVSRRTGHELVQGFEPYDFRYWYSDSDDMITPILRSTFTADVATPILTSGNSLRGSAWGQKLYKALACAEIPCEKGKIIINQVDLKSHMANPVARKFANRLYTY
jgi:hypothetical protein